MTDISKIDSSLLAQLQAPKAETEKKDKLGQNAFLELMITQLNNQNPLDPQDNSEFVAQLAQFSSVQSLEELNQSMQTMANSYQSSQALQASAMVGRSVMVPTDTALLTDGGVVRGSVSLDSSTSNLTIDVYDDVGTLVNQYQFGQQAAGDIDFVWDGRDSNGNTLAPGRYKFAAHASNGNESKDAEVVLGANVNSVTIGPNGALTLNLNGIGPMPFSDVKTFL